MDGNLETNALHPSRVLEGVERMATTGGLVLAKAKSESAAERLGELFDAHHQRLYRLARRLLSDAEEAQDLMQEAFLRAAQRPGAVPDGTAAEAWLVRVLVNLCRDRYRRRMVQKAGKPHLPMPPPSPDPESRTVAQATVCAALGTLPARRRAIVVLAELEQLPSTEIARLLGITQVTVRWHLSLGRRQLKDLLQPVARAAGSARGGANDEL